MPVFSRKDAEAQREEEAKGSFFASSSLCASASLREISLI
jgi:hypothetical protein